MTYVLFGIVNYLIEQEITKILQDNAIDSISINKYNLENDLLSTILNDATSISLFGDKKAIIVNNSYIFTGSTNKKNLEQDTSLLEKYLESPNSDCLLIFVVPNEKLDERKKITKLSKKMGKVKEFNQIDTKTIVKKMCEGYTITNDTIDLLIQRVGDNVLLLSNEIDKIKLYKDDKKITNDDILDLTSKSLETNNFRLIDAIISKDKELAISLYEERIKQSEEPIAIVIALANQIRIMYQVKELYKMGHTEHDVASILAIHPYRVKLAAGNSRKYTSEVLLEQLKALANLDIAIKTGQLDKTLGLELFILSI